MTGGGWLACLSPPGQAAVATLGLCGAGAWPAVRALFQPRRGELPASPVAGRFWLGRLGGAVGDEVVLAVRRTEPVVWLEAHCHGGKEVVRFLTEALQGQGLLPCSWQDFLRNVGDDLLTVHAAEALAQATTTRAAAVLLDQYTGALGRTLDAILAALEVGETAAAVGQLDELRRWAPLGRHLTQPWRVTVAGAPNVGKSSLVNALAGYQRSVVSVVPGTTRDVVTVRLALGGWPVEVADTAGLREGGGALEQEGMRLARAAAGAADLCLWVLDASAPPAWPDADLGAVLLVVNKIDCAPMWPLDQARDAVRLSAVSGEGLPELCARVTNLLVPESPAPGAAVPFTQELASAIATASRHLAAGDVGTATCVLSSLRQRS